MPFNVDNMATMEDCIQLHNTELDKKRKRKKNFSVEEENLIQTIAEENIDVINSKFCNEVTNKRKQQVWQTIADKVNSLGISCRTIAEIKEKWGNMTRKAKKTFTDYRLSQRQTGGGPPPPEMSQATTNIIDMLKDTASFNGVPGDDIVNSHKAEIAGQCPDDQITCIPANADVAPGTSNEPEDTDTVVHAQNSQILTQQTATEKKVRKTEKHPKIRQEDVLEMQFSVLKGKLDQQELEEEKSRLQSEKFSLQIKLLERMIQNQNSLSLETIDPSQLLLSLMN